VVSVYHILLELGNALRHIIGWTCVQQKFRRTEARRKVGPGQIRQVVAANLFIKSECALRRDGSHGNQHYFPVDLHRVDVVNQIVAGLIQMIPCLLGQLLL